MANLPVPANLSEADYEAIEGAVMETARGRWFLAEYARRNRHADTTMLLKALDRIEGAMRGEHSVEPVDRIRFDLVEMSKAIARTKAEIAAIKPDADHHGQFGAARGGQAGRRSTRQVGGGERGARLRRAGDGGRDLRHSRLRRARPRDRLD